MSNFVLFKQIINIAYNSTKQLEAIVDRAIKLVENNNLREAQSVLSRGRGFVDFSDIKYQIFKQINVDFNVPEPEMLKEINFSLYQVLVNPEYVDEYTDYPDWFWVLFTINETFDFFTNEAAKKVQNPKYKEYVLSLLREFKRKFLVLEAYKDILEDKVPCYPHQ